MELRNIKTFLRASELQSFSLTADKLGYSQSTITVQIRQLEEELGVELFERIGKRVKLTQQGQSFAAKAKEIIDAVDNARASVGEREEIRGTLTIAAAESICTSMLPDILAVYRENYPAVEMIVRTSTNVAMYDTLQKNDVDMIYILEHLLYRDNWIKAADHKEPMIFVGSSDNPLAKKGTASIEEIAGQPLFLTEKGYSYRFDLDNAAAERGILLRPGLDITNTDVIVDALLRGNGISFLPEFVVRDYIKRGLLRKIKSHEFPCSMWSQLIYHKNKALTPQMKAFIHTVQAYLAAK